MLTVGLVAGKILLLASSRPRARAPEGSAAPAEAWEAEQKGTSHAGLWTPATPQIPMAIDCCFERDGTSKGRGRSAGSWPSAGPRIKKLVRQSW